MYLIYCGPEKFYGWSKFGQYDEVKDRAPWVKLWKKFTIIPSCRDNCTLQQEQPDNFIGNVSLCLGDLTILPISYSDQSDKPVSTSLTYY